MADLVTHTALVLLPGLVARWRWTPLVASGAALPDVTGRAAPLALELLLRHGVPVPELAIFALPATHEPPGAALVAGLLAASFAPGERARAFVGLAAGCLSHTALDVLQDHHGVGYLLLAPLSYHRFELGWIGSEATVPLALPLLGATALAAGWRLWSPSTREGRPGGPGGWGGAERREPDQE